MPCLQVAYRWQVGFVNATRIEGRPPDGCLGDAPGSGAAVPDGGWARKWHPYDLPKGYHTPPGRRAGQPCEVPELGYGR